MKKYFAYYRVSTGGQTTKQQHAEVINYAKAHGQYVGGVDEQVSGKSMDNRPLLREAINKCKAEGLTLLVLKLDRISRDAADTFAIYKECPFECVQQDTTDILTLSIFAGLAAKERQMISQRTKAKLEQLKKDGKKLGSPLYQKDAKGHLSKEAERQLAENRERMANARRDAADNNDANVKAWAVIENRQGSLQQLADILNAAGFRTPHGKEWQKMSIKRLIERYDN